MLEQTVTRLYDGSIPNKNSVKILYHDTVFELTIALWVHGATHVKIWYSKWLKTQCRDSKYTVFHTIDLLMIWHNHSTVIATRGRSLTPSIKTDDAVATHTLTRLNIARITDDRHILCDYCNYDFKLSVSVHYSVY